MRYRELPGRVRAWSPFSHGWRCQSCPEVFVLDGSIVDSENCRFRNLEKQMRIDLFSAIYKKSFSDKNRPENLDTILEDQTPSEHEASKEKKKLEKYIESVIKETSRTKILEPAVDAPEDPLSLTPFEE